MIKAVDNGLGITIVVIKMLISPFAMCPNFDCYILSQKQNDSRNDF